MFGPDLAKPKKDAAPASESAPVENKEGASKDGAKVSFPAPEGFDAGGRAEGDEFEAVAKLCVEPGGKLCLVALDGVALSPSSAEDKEAPAKAGGFQDAVESGLMPA